MGVTFGKFNESLNFMFGITRIGDKDEGFDILNNPFIDYIGYELSEILNMEKKYDFEPCDQGFVDSFVKKNAQGWYDQPLCFKDRDRVSMTGNIFQQTYAVPAIGIAYCKNTTANGDWCATKDEIDNWLQEHPSFFIH